MSELLRGAPAAKAETERLRQRCEALQARGVQPALAIVRVGAREDDLAYERAAVRRCELAGIAVRQFPLPSDCAQHELLAVIDAINADPALHGCLLFRPLPDRAMERAACERLAPEKDVDGMTRASMAHVFAGDGPGFAPCTAEACMRLLAHYGIDPAGKRVVILGRSLVVGKPLAMLMLAQNATVTVCHSKTPDAAQLCRAADILVVAAGRAALADKAYLRAGQIVLDVGIHETADGTLCGDVRASDAEALAAAYSPVPGGVGSVTTTVLAAHVIEACEKLLAISQDS